MLNAQLFGRHPGFLKQTEGWGEKAISTEGRSKGVVHKRDSNPKSNMAA